jgi:hypothetical protein
MGDVVCMAGMTILLFFNFFENPATLLSMIQGKVRSKRWERFLQDHYHMVMVKMVKGFYKV